MFIIILGIGLCIYIGLLFLPYKEPYSDYLSFYLNATSFAQKGSLYAPEYISLFPHLSGYIVLLGIIMKFTTTSYFIVVLTNLIFQMIGTYFVYQIFKKDKNKAYFATLLWFISPLHILWSMMCIPIILFQTCFVGCILLFKSLLSKQENKKMFVLMSLFLGLALGISNLFRPIMPIFIIAILIYYLFLIVFYLGKKWKIYLASILCIIISYFIVGKAHIYLLEKETLYKTSNIPGWTIYVGSFEPAGSWNPDVSATFDELWKSTNKDIVKAQKLFQKKAIDNYKERGIIRNIRFGKNKFWALTSGLDILSSDILMYQVENITKEMKFLARFLVGFWLLLILFLFSFCTFKKIRNKNKNLSFCSLLFIGIILSHLMTETSPRYFIPIYVPLFLMAFSNLEEKNDENNCIF